MKKFTLVLAFIGMITLQSCSTNNGNNNYNTTSEVFEYTHVNFLPNNYSVVLTYPHSILSSNMVLVYRLSGSFQGEDIWKLLPETYYFNDGTLDLRYDNNFTRFDTEIHLEGFNLAGVNNSYKLNQIFRVVVVPGYFGKNNKMNFKDYNAVVKALNIDESKIIKV